MAETQKELSDACHDEAKADADKKDAQKDAKRDVTAC